MSKSQSREFARPYVRTLAARLVAQWEAARSVVGDASKIDVRELLPGIPTFSDDLALL